MVKLLEPDKCNGCGDCASVCVYGLITMDKETNKPIIQSDKCTDCGICLTYCKTGAID